MNNGEAINILAQCKGNFREASEQIISEFQIQETELHHIRRRLTDLKNIRRDFVKRGDVNTWENLHFFNIPPPTTMSSKKRKSSNSLSEPMKQLVFEVDPTQDIRTPLLKLHSKQLRHRLNSILTHIKSLADLEEVPPKVIASLCLQLICSEEKDYATVDMCKDIVVKGTYMPHNSILSEKNSSFLLDFLLIGKQKYRELRRFLKEDNITLASYDKVSTFRQESCLVNEMKYFQSDFGTPVGIYLPYHLLVAQTLSEIIDVEGINTVNYP